jgi:hypothetical protein
MAGNIELRLTQDSSARGGQATHDLRLSTYDSRLSSISRQSVFEMRTFHREDAPLQ